MRNLTHLTGAALMVGVLLLLACEESPVTPVGDLVPSFAKPPGGGGGGPNSGTPLSVTLSTDGDVAGDGIGPYVDDVDGVLAIVDQNDDLKFDIDTPKKGTLREICFHFRFENLVDEPTNPAVLENPTICGGPLWNTRGVLKELNGMEPGESGEFGSRFIVTSDTGIEYKVRYGAATISSLVTVADSMTAA